MQMKIELMNDVSYTPAIAGWGNSRDRHGLYGAEDMAGVDAPVNELPSALLEFKEFMILEREIFVTARNHVIWARTSRVDDPLKFLVPDEFHDATVHANLRHLMMEKHDRGVHQDQWRMHLPLVSETSWTARMSYRDIIKMHKYFLYLAASVDTQLRPRFAKVAEELYNLLLRFIPHRHIINRAIEQMKEVHFLNENRVSRFNGATAGNDFYIASMDIPIALRAQLVRHREIAFVDDFFDQLCQTGIQGATIGDIVTVQAVAKHDVWASVIGKRHCWIAQADLWEPITRQFERLPLPCEDGICPFAADAEARLQPGKDPGAPCPRYCNLNGKDKEPWKSAMRIEAIKRGVATSYWLDQIDVAS